MNFISFNQEFDLSSWQLDVNVTEEDNITAIAKRSSEQLLVAHVYILPKTLSDKDVQLVYNVSACAYTCTCIILLM